MWFGRRSYLVWMTLIWHVVVISLVEFWSDSWSGVCEVPPKYFETKMYIDHVYISSILLSNLDPTSFRMLDCQTHHTTTRTQTKRVNTESYESRPSIGTKPFFSEHYKYHPSTALALPNHAYSVKFRRDNFQSSTTPSQMWSSQLNLPREFLPHIVTILVQPHTLAVRKDLRSRTMIFSLIWWVVTKTGLETSNESHLFWLEHLNIY